MKTVFINGSPKKKLSVSSYLLGIVRLLLKGEVVTEQVRNAKDHERILNSIRDANTVVFGVPLYVDGVPSHMLTFMKEMEKFCVENQIHLNVYVVSNGGFIEGCQNKALMQVFENFCKRCNFQWCGGVGIGGGVMLNVMRIMFFVYLGLFVLNTVTSGLTASLPIFAEQLLVVLFFSLGAFFYCLRMGIAVNKGTACGVKYTRILLPSFLFILAADIFFIIISVFQGGIFRGWLSRK
jgi:hypothetical protein